MHYAEFDLNAAEGVRLSADYRFDGRFYPRGHALNKEDLIIFKMYGVRHVYGAQADDNDLDNRTALQMIAAKVCGSGTAFIVGHDGICRIVADVNGVFAVSAERIAKFNRLHPDLMLNTVQPYQVVSKGEVLARLELMAPLMTEAAVEDILFRLSGNVALLQMRELRPLRTAFVYTKVFDSEAETTHLTAVVKRLVTSLADYRLDFTGEYNSSYTVEDVADELQNAIDAGYEAIFVLGAAPSGNQHDVLPDALRKIADDVVIGQMPVAGGSDLMLAQKRGAKIFVLPYHYDTMNVAPVNRCLRQALTAEKIIPADYEHMESVFLPAVEVLPADMPGRLVSAKNSASKSKKAVIAAVILAAGIGSRASRRKLMVELPDGKPLFLHAVEAAIASDAGPVFVITGYNHDEMSEYLDKLDVNVIYNPLYRAGVKTSIALGLKSVPEFCDGAMLFPADMPNLSAADLNKLISSFRRGKERQVSVFVRKGVKSNPIIWSRELFSRADIVPENAHLRPVFMEHSDYTNTVEVRDSAKLLDVNYPNDLQQLGVKTDAPVNEN